jgi:hypothetical protein
LELGDPAVDWAMLFGPRRDDPGRVAEGTLPPGLALDPSVRERLAIYSRASLLDWTIDPLADWINAGEAPECGTRVGEMRGAARNLGAGRLPSGCA